MTFQLTLARTEPGRILVCADDESTARRVELPLAEFGYETSVVDRVERLVQALLESRPDVCLVAGVTDEGVLQSVAGEVQTHRLTTQLVRISEPSDCESSSSWGTLEKPYTPATLHSFIRSAVHRSQLLAENVRLRQRIDRPKLARSASRNTLMQELHDKAAAVAEEGTAVLACGEPGTDVVETAQLVHRFSSRSQRPLIKLECGVLSAECLLLELFGERSETAPSATSGSGGLLDSADGGTIVLVDVDTIALPVQRRLADVLQSSSDDRIHQTPLARQPRVIATTHADLDELVRSHKFDADLSLLLNKSVLTVPPLRHRKEEIAGLTEEFLAELALREGRPRKRLTVEALTLLESRDWSRNHAELAGALDRACSLDATGWLTAEMLLPWLPESGGRGHASPGMSLREMERKLIESTFARCGGNRERTAKSLQIGLRTLSGKLREYGYPPRGAPGSNVTTLHRKAA